ncbi:MAG: hypothetical protein IPN33_26160 [Saprospiraceae bacterium]|nr:hypothetical protein [Saprospiraceae bacterium]
MARLKDQSAAYEKALANSQMTKEKAAVLNQLLKNMERALTRSPGLPGRLVYSSTTFTPPPMQLWRKKRCPPCAAIEQRQWDQVQPQIDILAEVLATFAKEIERPLGR